MQKYVPLVEQNVMKLEVFILGGQRIDQKRKKGWWRGRRERIEKGSREMCTYCITPIAKWLCDTPLVILTLKFHDLHPFLIYTPIPSVYAHPVFYCVMKLEVFILGGQRIDQKRKKGWWRGRRERIEKGSRERIEKREKR